jgi:hypothetical protein
MNKLAPLGGLGGENKGGLGGAKGTWGIKSNLSHYIPEIRFYF